ncbi:MAG: PorT family protein [Cyclobacteriaceae bacterium]|nr:PorT family protein [Cyclobacteriaceae bacterium HetDA_MAG_MS6]
MKRITFLSCILLVSAVAYGQGFKVGLKGGLNFPSAEALGLQDGIQTSDLSGNAGYHIGAFARLKFSKFAIQPEVLYSFQSVDFSLNVPTPGGSATDIKQKISYLTVPVMARIYILSGLNLQIGPQFGFLLTGDVESNDNDLDGSDLKDELSASDISLGVGAGLDLPFGLDVHARYNIGLKDVNDTADAEEAKNSVFQVSVGFSIFGLGD